MELRRVSAIACVLLNFFVFTSAFFPIGFNGDEAPLFVKATPHKTFGIFSRPPEHKDDEGDNQKDPGLFGHIGNVMKGGTIGIHFEANPMKDFHTAMNDAKKFMPPIPPLPGFHKPKRDPHRPAGDKVRPKPHTPVEDWESEEDDEPGRDKVPPKVPPHKPVEEVWESEEEEDKPWVQKEPEKPGKKPPTWDDIGEEPEEEESKIPFAEIIQPRNRRGGRFKRFIESKVYHVPLTFRSNAKPYEVKIKRDKKES